MNQIEIRNITTPYEYQELFWVIDGKALPDYLCAWASKFNDDKIISLMKPFNGLCPAWVKDLDWRADVRFVWTLIEKESSILPILLCPDDLDFSCIVVVVEVEKTKDFVYWSRIGYVIHDNENFEEEKKNGILNINAYSDRDWSMYGDNIAFAKVDSDEWYQWISENWDDELYRRRMNYTSPYYQTDGNVCWIQDMNWFFDRVEYDHMTNAYWEFQTLKQLNEFAQRDKMSVKECADFLSSLTRTGKELLEKHLNDYGEILLHLFASEQVGEPLINLLSKKAESKNYVSIYCKAIEIMWKYGNEAVVNVVDVTILERLSDEDEVWQKFGTYISHDFKVYINDIILKENLMMWGSKPLS